MATFTSQIESYAGSATSWSSVVSIALDSAVVDVLNRTIALRPDMASLFSSDVTMTSPSGVDVSDGYPIISVYRDGFRCTSGRSVMKREYTDVDSLYYADKRTPVAYTENGYLYVLPHPTLSTPAVASKVGAGTVDDSAGTITQFPESMYNAVVLFASNRLLSAKIAGVRDDFVTELILVDAPTIDWTGIPSVPAAPSVSAASFTVSSALPTYTSPTVGGATESLTATMETATIGNSTDILDFSKWFSVFGQYIENDEDVELARSQAEKISAYLNSYSQALQDSVAEFNQESAKYNADLQTHVEGARLVDANESRKVALYQASIASYQAQVNAIVSENMGQVQTAAAHVAQILSKYAPQIAWLQSQLETTAVQYRLEFEHLGGSTK